MKNTEKIYWKDLVEEAIKRRKEQKMTQKELAAFVGISTPTLQKFEDKKTNITLDASLLAKFLKRHLSIFCT